jgi:hypothetical protein
MESRTKLRVGFAMQAVSFAIIVACVCSILLEPSPDTGSRLVLAAFALYGLWVNMGRDVYAALTGEHWAVVLMVHGEPRMAERCAFKWTALICAGRMAREYKWLHHEYGQDAVRVGIVHQLITGGVV